MVAEPVAGGGGGAGDRVEVVADADQFRDVVVSPSRLVMTFGSNCTVRDSRATWGPSGSGTYQSGPR